MRNLVVKSLLLLNVALINVLLVACAGESDPLEKYNSLKGVEEHGERSDNQGAENPHPFIVEIEGGGSNTYGEFTVGKESIAPIRIIENNRLGSNYIKLASANVKNFPESNYTFTPSTTEPGVWNFKWKPSLAYMQGKLAKTERVEVEVISDKGQATSFFINISVTRSGEVPRIIEAKNIDGITVIEGGEPIKFEIVTKDPNYVDGEAYPTLGIHEYRNEDRAAFKANASTKIESDYSYKETTVHEGAGVFRHYRKLLLTDIATFRDRMNREVPDATSVQMCFLAAARSITGAESDPNRYCVTVNYLAQPAILTWISTDLTANAGEEKTFNFKVSTANGLSTVEIHTPDVQIASLSGKKSLTLNAGGTDKEKTYTLTWTPSCNAKAIKKYPINLIVRSSLNGKMIKTTIPFELEALNSDKCAPKGK
jgi:hypothetical protein